MWIVHFSFINDKKIVWNNQYPLKVDEFSKTLQINVRFEVLKLRRSEFNCKNQKKLTL